MGPVRGPRQDTKTPRHRLVTGAGVGEGRDSSVWSSEVQPSQAERLAVLPPENNDPDSLVLLITIEFPNLIPRFKCN